MPRTPGDTRSESSSTGSSPKSSTQTTPHNSPQSVSSTLASSSKSPIKYFVVKPNNQKILHVALSKSVYATSPKSEARFNKAIQVSVHPIIDHLTYILITMTLFLYTEHVLVIDIYHYCVQDGKEVYLIFSTVGSGHFQGYARVTGQSSKDKCPDMSGDGLGGTFKIEWLKEYVHIM